jgi:hypothetical protein
MASRVIFLVGLLLCGFSNLVLADNKTANSGVSTLYNAELGITFSLNVDPDDDYINFFLSSPPYSWVGIGIGSSMAGSLMLIFYSSADGKGWWFIALHTICRHH